MITCTFDCTAEGLPSIVRFCEERELTVRTRRAPNGHEEVSMDVERTADLTRLGELYLDE